MLILKPGRERPLLKGHPWIFSGAVASCPDLEPGAPVSIYSSSKEFLGQGLTNSGSDIFARLITTSDAPIEEVLTNHIQTATARRLNFFNPNLTNAYRLINAEADRLPGLIVDRYANWLVIQISIAGMERYRDLIIKALLSLLPIEGIYEKSHSTSRRREGLADRQGYILGEKAPLISILEEGVAFEVDIVEGQKTGFFLDQREMRKWVKELSFQKNVLNCFSYTGGFSLYALHGGATHVDSVDISSKACEQMKRHFAAFSNWNVYASDVFDFLAQSTKEYDLIILDPPAFAKKKSDLGAALGAYRKLNEMGLKKLAKGGILITSSCSGHIDQQAFEEAVLAAVRSSNRMMQIIGNHRLASDHPILPCFPEGTYLKSMVMVDCE